MTLATNQGLFNLESFEDLTYRKFCDNHNIEGYKIQILSGFQDCKQELYKKYIRYKLLVSLLRLYGDNSI